MTKIDLNSDVFFILLRLFRQLRPTKIVETGTFTGLGSTNIIASLIKSLGLNTVFYSIEVNPELIREAGNNLRMLGLSEQVQLINGLSIDRNSLPSIESIKKEIDNKKFPDDIFIDHDEVDRELAYFSETNFPTVSDNMLEKCLCLFGYHPDFVLLDSAGHLGRLEFKYLLERLKGPGSIYIGLDDIFHIKHFENFCFAMRNSAFRLVDITKERFGFCLLEYIL